MPKRGGAYDRHEISRDSDLRGEATGPGDAVAGKLIGPYVYPKYVARVGHTFKNSFSFQTSGDAEAKVVRRCGSPGGVRVGRGHRELRDSSRGEERVVADLLTPVIMSTSRSR